MTSTIDEPAAPAGPPASTRRHCIAPKGASMCRYRSGSTGRWCACASSRREPMTCSWRTWSREPAICRSARRRSRLHSARPWRKRDYTFATYRGHAHTLARGSSMTGVMGELLGRSCGVLSGKGGSMHLTDVQHGVMGSYAIVGAHLTIALGAAWSAQYRGERRVAVAFFGDGTTNIGAFHESLNLAAVWKLPVVFVCENNLYMEYTPIGAVTAVANPAADRASAYGLDSILVDGNDADAMYLTAREALDRARSGGGPSLIEARTYRSCGHSRADPGKYRPDAEVAAWKAYDPIALYRSRLVARGVRRSRPRRDRGDGRWRRRDRDGRREGIAAHRGRMSSCATCGRMEGRHGGTDLSRRGRSRDRAGDGARSQRRLSRGGCRRRRGRVQGDGRVAGTLRAGARARHPDLGAGDPRRGDGRRDDRASAHRRDHVRGLLRSVLGPGRQPDCEELVHDRRPGELPAGDQVRQRRRSAFRSAALAVGRELGDGGPRAQGRCAVESRPTSSASSPPRSATRTR